MRRLAAVLLLLSPLAWAQDYPAVRPGVPLRFPFDHGAHPAFRTEWWYVTGWVKTADQRELGFQITFFRTRPPARQDNPSRFAPRQIILAHAALSDAKAGRLLHDQKAARQGFGLAEAAVGNTDLVLDDWSLLRAHDGSLHARAVSDVFSLDLDLAPTQPELAQGDGGFSRKGQAASYYYSLPHLAVRGRVGESGKETAVSGEAWLDHEWSSQLLDADAVGWDWLGVNLDDGGALTAFRLRGKDGDALWAGGSWRDRDGKVTIFTPRDVAFEPVRRWRSPRTNTEYPVEWRVRVLGRDILVIPLFDDQELDSRAAGGPVYWEGAVRGSGGFAGRGYLELTGYLERLKL
jgi:predicted secreted hydrolase